MNPVERIRSKEVLGKEKFLKMLTALNVEIVKMVYQTDKRVTK